LGERFRREAESEWNDKHKDKKPDEVPAAQRESETAELYQQRCWQVEATFVSLFAGAPGSPQDAFQATVDQALFWANDGRILNWLAPGGGNLAERAAATDDDRAVARLLYRSVLNRPPTDDEQARVVDYLAHDRAERGRAIQDIIWALLTSVEFRFNH
jgi:hypothetical protein